MRSVCTLCKVSFYVCVCVCFVLVSTDGRWCLKQLIDDEISYFEEERLRWFSWC